MNYQLSSYHLSQCEFFRSLAVSEYGKRHWAAAKAHPEKKWGHRLIAVLEFCPIIGQLSSFLECICVKVGSKLQPPKRIAFSTQEGCNGPVEQESARRVVALLQRRSERGVHFNQENLVSNLKGGACSVMALDFIRDYLRKKAIRRIDDQSSLKEVLECVRKVANKHIFGCSEDQRDIQAAFNTIEKDPEESSDDFKRAKIQSLANYYDLKVLSATEAVDLRGGHPDRKIARLVDKMPSGAYLLRVLFSEDNQKGEKCGHSIVFIKHEKASFYFEPNFGTFSFPAYSGRNVWSETKKVYREFGVHDFRIYQMAL